MQSGPPTDYEAEGAVLGAVVVAPTQATRVLDVLKEEDFYLEKHRSIFGAIREMQKSGEDIDSLTVAIRAEVKREYVQKLAATVPLASNAATYAMRVRDIAERRRIWMVGMEIQEMASNGVSDAIGASLTALRALDKEKIPSGEGKRASELVLEAYDCYEQKASSKGPPGVPWPVTEATNITGGLRRGRLYVILASYGLGKSALAGQLASESANQGRRTGIFSWEMSRTEWVERMAVQRTHKINARALDWGQLDKEQLKVYVDELAKIGKLPLWIWSCRGEDHMDFVRRKVELEGLDFVIVDYLQRMLLDPRHLEQETAKQASEAKSIARECDCAFVLLSQRSYEGRARNSGQILEAADVVLQIERDGGQWNWNILKQRHGEIGEIAVTFRGSVIGFQDAVF